MNIKCWLLVASLCIIGQTAFTQDVIYRKNGEILKVIQLTPSGKSRSYRLPGDETGIVRYISIQAIDSILYENGIRDIFTLPTSLAQLPAQREAKAFNRSYVAVDGSALLFYQNLQISYEYLLGKGYVGIFGTLAKNLDPFKATEYIDYTYEYSNPYYASMLRYLNTSFRMGVNAYIFPPGFFRISAGLSWITGRYDYERTEYLNQEPYMRTTLEKNRGMNGILFSPALNVQPDDFYQIRLGVDIPLSSSAKFNTGMFRLELAINL
jgi:hypothetical protein